jgi:hypothetical protein
LSIPHKVAPNGFLYRSIGRLSLKKMHLLFLSGFLFFCPSAFPAKKFINYMVSPSDRKKSGVHITAIARDGGDVLLRLTNDSTETIKVCAQTFIITAPPNVRKIALPSGEMVFAFNDGKQVKLCYGVEKFSNAHMVSYSNSSNITSPKIVDNSQKTGRENCTSSYCGFYDDGNYGAEGWVAPGDSLLFKVPLKFLAESYRIYIRYNYESEENSRNNSAHLAYFDSGELQTDLRANIRKPDPQKGKSLGKELPKYGNSPSAGRPRVTPTAYNKRALSSGSKKLQLKKPQDKKNKENEILPPAPDSQDILKNQKFKLR